MRPAQATNQAAFIMIPVGADSSAMRPAQATDQAGFITRTPSGGRFSANDNGCPWLAT